MNSNLVAHWFGDVDVHEVQSVLDAQDARPHRLCIAQCSNGQANRRIVAVDED